MNPELRLEAMRIAQAQLPPCTSVEVLIEEAAKILNWLRGEVRLTPSELLMRARAEASRPDGLIPLD